MIILTDPDYDTYYVVEANLETGEFIELDENVMLPLYWNIEDGWGPIISATVYSEDEVLEFDLPLESHWVKVTTLTTFVASLNTYQLNTTFCLDRNVRVHPTTMITDPGSEKKTHLRIA